MPSSIPEFMAMVIMADRGHSVYQHTLIGQRRVGWIAALLSLLLFIIPAQAADYIVERGDVLEVSVLGAPGLHRRAPIDASGRFSVPLIGNIDAAGLSLSKISEKLRDILIAKNIVRNPEVTIGVAEYRPVYVAGDVVKPGAYPYRPGMTVRDAVALAEGYDLLHMRGRDPLLEGADARGDFQSSAVELAKQTARVARIKAELADRKEMDLKDLHALPVQPTVVAEITQIESQQLTADREDSEREKASLARTIMATQEQIFALRQQQDHAADALEQQTRAFNRARELMQRGLMQSVRMEEGQRAVAAAQNLLFDIQSRAAQARRDLEDAMRRLQTADDQRRIRLLQELREAVSQVATAGSRLQAASDKMRYTGAAQSRRASNAPMEPPEVVIYRFRDGARPTNGDEATTLLPGDNLQITTKLELYKLLGLAAPNSNSTGPK
jgi:polysaccharide biosynthesis/export protein